MWQHILALPLEAKGIPLLGVAGLAVWAWLNRPTTVPKKIRLLNHFQRLFPEWALQRQARVIEHTFDSEIAEAKAKKESAEASLVVATFNKGVEDDSRMPGLYVRGTWVLMFNSLDYFGAASRFDSRTRKQVPNPDTSVTVDDTQVSLVNRYEAQSRKKVEYTLTIQRSTKRFSESFNVLAEPPGWI